MKKKVMITGAAGFIGTFLRKHFSELYQIRLVDIKNIEDPMGHEVMMANIENMEEMQKACAGMDTVIHLAADRRMEANFYETLLPLNIIGTYNVFQAAVDQGCKRIVFASSINAVWGYPRDVGGVTPDLPVNPPNVYGVTKCYGEALGRCFVNKDKISFIAVRIGGINTSGQGDMKTLEQTQAWISARDLCQLFQGCVDVKGVDFAIVHGLSKHKNSFLDIASTCQLLGYEPHDGTATI